MEEENWDESTETEQSNWDYYEDYYDDYDYYYDYDYRDRDNPCANAYYGSRRSVARNLLASDLGIIAKGGTDNSMNFAVTDLKTTDPLSGVTLEVYNYQQQLLGSVVTDGQGMAQIEKTSNQPFLLVAKQGQQRGYLRLDAGSSLSLSSFDVQGRKIQKGIKGFIYGERGVWRPGDSLYLAFMLEDRNQLLPEKHPVAFELLNPKGQVMKRSVKTNGVGGFYNFSTHTDQDAPTGNWMARVKVGGASFEKRLKIETIKPNRLKILLDFGRELLTSNSESMRGDLEVKWLHGAIAKNLKAKIDVTLSPTKTSFNKHNDFVFDDPTRQFRAEEQSMFDGRINSEGKAEVLADLNVDDAAPGFLKASFKARVFEEGGDFSVDRFSIPYSPYDQYVGIRLPKGDKARGMLLTDVDHNIDIVTVDSEGNPVAVGDLEVKVYKVRWRWWWETGNENSNYNNTEYNQLVYEGNASTGSDGKGQFAFQIKYPDWGRYLVRVSDESGGHAAGKFVYIDWPGWAGDAQRENPGGASMLTFTTNKDNYEVGETMNVTFPSSGVGRALISVETGSKVIYSAWAEAQPEKTHHSIPVTAEMAPNVYVNVTLIQPHNQQKNDAPIRLYGIVPVKVEDPETHITPVLNMANELAPEKPVYIEVEEKNGKPMTYTLAVVDDGLLDLTRFKTPDPWSQFYAREALGVKTWDVYDDVIGAFGGKIERLLSIGGDGDNANRGKNRANRFKPMVKFLGPFTLESGETNKHNFMMPRYVGSVRTMVIAGQEGAYGFAEKTTPVKTPLMVLATLPRVVGPGEQVKLPVTVFAMEKNIQNVQVKVKSNSLFNVNGAANKALTFTEVGDQVIEFDLTAAQSLGVAKVQIEATSGNQKALYDIELDVRNANPPSTEVVAGITENGSTWTTSFTPQGLAGTNKVSLEVSSIPPIDFGRRLKYLTQYPHGCVEQTTSGAFPQLYLSEVLELDDKMKERTTQNVKAGISRLKSFQQSNGGFSYWPGGNDANAWGSTYAGHFLVEASKQGYALPPNMLKNWIKFQKQTAREWKRLSRRNRNYYKYNDVAQAYRLYTLALADAPELGAMNRLKERDDLTPQASWRLAAAYQLAGRPEVAQKLIASLSEDVPEYTELSYNFGSSDRDRAMIIETLTLMEDRSKAAPMVQDLAKTLSSQRWLSTQTTAYGLLAISKFVKSANLENGMEFTYTIDGKTQKKTSAKPVVILDLNINDANAHNISVKSESDQLLNARVVMEGIPAPGNETAAASNLRMKAVYKNLKGEVIDVSRLEQGTDFLAEVTITNPGTRGNLKELALSQIFPSGWEIRNLRLDGTESSLVLDKPTYQDIRDDRVLSYFDIRRNDSKTFVVLLNASYQGKYYLPAISCEAMYDNTIMARTTGQWVEVVQLGDLLGEN